MNKIMYLMAVVLISCQNKADIKNSNPMPDTTAPVTDTITVVKTIKGTNCFAYIKNRDTIRLTMTLTDSMATGTLVYNLYEKDKNKGTIKGSLHSDTLLADYSFLSEGTRSVRQVIFLVKGNILLQGTGSMKEQNGRLVFSNKKDVSFDGSTILEPVDCNSFRVK